MLIRIMSLNSLVLPGVGELDRQVGLVEHRPFLDIGGYGQLAAACPMAVSTIL